MPRRPEFRDLDAAEIEAVLARNHVGRLAYSVDDRVDIEPMHYVYEGGSLYGRTAAGTKLASVARNYRVAFEVDEVDGLFDWRSVVVHGGFYRIPPAGTGRRNRDFDWALDLLRTLVPKTMTPEDPTPERSVLFRIPVQQATGRCAVPARARAAPGAEDGCACAATGGDRRRAGAIAETGPRARR